MEKTGSEVWLGYAGIGYGPKQVVVTIAQYPLKISSLEKNRVKKLVNFFLSLPEPLNIQSAVPSSSRVVASTEGALPVSYSDLTAGNSWTGMQANTLGIPPVNSIHKRGSYSSAQLNK